MDLQHLRSATRPEHEATEAAMPLLGPGLTVGRYAEVLRCLLPLLLSWEAWSAEHAPARLRALLAARRRSAWLEADLRLLDRPLHAGGEGGLQGSRRSGLTSLDSLDRLGSPERLGSLDCSLDSLDSRLPALPWSAIILEPGETESTCGRGEFEAGFLGALYVLEGSTLGGRLLAKQVEAALGLTPGQGSAYFQGHGAATGAMWREVTAEIAAVPDASAERLIGAARRTFGAFRQALEGCEGLPVEPAAREH